MALTNSLSLSKPKKAMINERLPGLDGIRAVAISMVIFFHYFTGPIYATPGGFIEPGSVWAYLERFSELFWSGVDLFFVLSGFLITRNLLNNIEATNLFKTFYIRRSLRIFPAYFLFIGAYWLFVYYGCSGECDLEFLPPLWPYVLYVQNFYHWISGIAPPTSLGALWSLAVEEQFYIFLPFLLLIVQRKYSQYLFVVALCLSLSLRFLVTDYNPSVTFFRLDGLAFGGLLACYSTRFGFPKIANTTLLVVLTVFLIGFFYITWKDPTLEETSYAYCLFGAIGVVLILVAVTHKDRFFGRILDCAPMAWVGKRSYFIYLWHMFVVSFLHRIIDGPSISLVSIKDVYITAMALAITLLLAELSWKFVEHPLIQFGHHFTYAKHSKNLNS